MSDMSDFNFDDLDLELETELSDRPQPTLGDVIAEWQSGSGNLPGPTVLYGLSDLTQDQVVSLKPIWVTLDATYRRVLMQMLVDAMETNFELDYTAFGLATLSDTDAGVRQAAIEVLGENHSLQLLRQLIHMARQDSHTQVRAEATRALGRYIQASELGDIDAELGHEVEQIVHGLLTDTSEEVQLSALESIAHCSRLDVSSNIQSAYESQDLEKQVSALIAMGHTCDKRWEQIVLDELNSRDLPLRREAAQAAGEIQLASAVPALAQMLANDEREAQERAIWALGEIASRQAVRVLEAAGEVAENAEDEDLLALIDDALGNASLLSGTNAMFMGFGDSELDD